MSTTESFVLGPMILFVKAVERIGANQFEWMIFYKLVPEVFQADCSLAFAPAPEDVYHFTISENGCVFATSAAVLDDTSYYRREPFWIWLVGIHEFLKSLMRVELFKLSGANRRAKVESLRL